MRTHRDAVAIRKPARNYCRNFGKHRRRRVGQRAIGFSRGEGANYFANYTGNAEHLRARTTSTTVVATAAAAPL